MNTKIQQMIDASMVEHQFQMRVDYETLVKQTVGETILAILATDHRHAIYTTFDKAAIDGATARIVDQVRKHWNFDNAIAGENHHSDKGYSLGTQKGYEAFVAKRNQK